MCRFDTLGGSTGFAEDFKLDTGTAANFQQVSAFKQCTMLAEDCFNLLHPHGVHKFKVSHAPHILHQQWGAVFPGGVDSVNKFFFKAVPTLVCSAGRLVSGPAFSRAERGQKDAPSPLP